MKFRTENDLIGDLEVPVEAYYGVQTQRALQNFKITHQKMRDYPQFIQAFGFVKKAAAQTNYELGILDKKIYKAIDRACDALISGKHKKEFPLDMTQGGAGTSINMNVNEVIANLALEIMGKEKGQYKICSPNDHVNLAQSTNDAYPTSIKLALLLMDKNLAKALKKTVAAFRKKGKEFAHIVKMGRTQLQDAVPMTLGQEFEAWATNLENELWLLENSAQSLTKINMGGTAIGTSLNTPQGYTQKVTEILSEITGITFSSAPNLIEATPDTGALTLYSSTLKHLAIKLSKICNDLRLLSSGPKAGLNEINLPAVQPGSSIMPGKVNPVIPEVVNQVCFRVIGHDLTVTMAAEAGQLELNVMEPVMSHSIMESIQQLQNALNTLTEKCIMGIKANKVVCKSMVDNSIGIVTALNPYIGYKNATKIAKEALYSGKRVYDLVLEHDLLSKKELDRILDPKNMLGQMMEA